MWFIADISKTARDKELKYTGRKKLKFSCSNILLFLEFYTYFIQGVRKWRITLNEVGSLHPKFVWHHVDSILLIFRKSVTGIFTFIFAVSVGCTISLLPVYRVLHFISFYRILWKCVDKMWQNYVTMTTLYHILYTLILLTTPILRFENPHPRRLRIYLLSIFVFRFI